MHPLTSVSVVLPAFNEAENLMSLVPEILRTVPDEFRLEVLVVDDGSTDHTHQVLKKLESEDSRIKGVVLRKNLGKSAAVSVGLEAALGEAVVLMDADGQDDPSEIPKLLAALLTNDLVTGRRVNRQDRLIKKATSPLYNFVTGKVTGIKGRDFNSGFKAMTNEVAQSLHLYGELHRFIPVLAQWQGFKIGEVGVHHRSRLHGRSKFGRARFWRGFLDLITVKFLTTYEARPLHLFGGLGTILTFAGTVLLAWMLILKIGGQPVGQRPALLAGVLFALVGIQLVSLGLLAELFVYSRRRIGEYASPKLTRQSSFEESQRSQVKPPASDSTGHERHDENES